MVNDFYGARGRKKVERIAVIGPPGSGKSTFAVKLGKALGAPVHHLDKHMFDGRTKKDKQEFLQVKEALLREDSWIIEGCSISTLEMRFARADTIIYLHFSRLLCIWRVSKRWLTFDVKAAETGCLDSVNWAMIKYIWTFNRDKWQGIKKLRQQYPNVEFLTFYHSRDLEKYLKSF